MLPEVSSGSNTVVYPSQLGTVLFWGVFDRMELQVVLGLDEEVVAQRKKTAVLDKNMGLNQFYFEVKKGTDEVGWMFELGNLRRWRLLSEEEH